MLYYKNTKIQIQTVRALYHQTYTMGGKTAIDNVDN